MRSIFIKKNDGPAVLALPKTGRNFTYLLSLILLSFIAPVIVSAQTTFTTVADGNWNSTSTWAGGVAPGTSISSTTTINIRHVVTYNRSADLLVYGTVNITNGTFRTALTGDGSGKSVTVYGGGKWNMCNGAMFLPIKSGGYGSTTGTNLFGNFYNENGTIIIYNSKVEIAQNWEDKSGTGAGVRTFIGGCLKVGQNFVNKNATDIYDNTFLELGLHGSGNWSNDYKVTFRNNCVLKLTGTGSVSNSSAATAVYGAGTTTPDIAALKISNGNVTNDKAWGAKIQNFCITGGSITGSVSSDFSGDITNNNTTAACTAANNATANCPTGTCRLSVAASPVSQPTCAGTGSNGSATVTILSGATQSCGGTTGVSYSWNTSPVQTTQTATNLAPGNYIVTVTDASGCVDTAHVTMTDPKPAAPALAVVNNCGSSTLTASGFTGTLTWSDGGTGNPRTVSSAGTFTVTQTISGCTSNASASVTTAPKTAPTAVITNNTGSTELTCTRTSISVTASGGTSYSWSNGTSVVGTSAALSITAPGTYTVTVTAANGCTDTESITVTQIPVTPVPTASSSQTFCNTDNSTVGSLAATGTSLKWYNSPSGGSALVLTASLVSGDYYVSQTLNGCESGRVKVTVVINNCAPACNFNTLSQGGWGNASSPLNQVFAQHFSSGLVIGGGTFKVTLTSAARVRNFLPNSGTPAVLKKSWIDPNSKDLKNTFAGQLIALRLNMALNPTMASAVITTGPFVNWTVQQLFTTSNNAISNIGNPSAAYLASLNNACERVNLSFHNNVITGFINCNGNSIVAAPAMASQQVVTDEPATEMVINAWPNPSNQYFNISVTGGGNNTIRVFDALGRVVETIKITNPGAVLKIGASYPRGFYILEVRSSTGAVMTRKLTRQ